MPMVRIIWNVKAKKTATHTLALALALTCKRWNFISMKFYMYEYICSTCAFVFDLEYSQ